MSAATHPAAAGHIRLPHRTRLELFAGLQLAAPVGVGFALLCVVTVALMGSAYPDWTELVADTLETEGRAQLARMAVEKAQLTTDSIQYYSANLAIMGDFYASLLMGTRAFDDSEVMLGYIGLPDYGSSPSTSLESITDRNENADARAYAYGVTNSQDDVIDWPQMSEIETSYSSIWDVMQISSVCDLVLEPVYKAALTSSAEFSDTTFIVTETGGTWRSEPWYDQSWLNDWVADESAEDIRPDLCPEGKTGFDGRCRTWYEAAVDAQAPAMTLYVFANTGKLGATYCDALFDADEDLAGVIGLDVGMAFFNDVTDTYVSPNGYGIIFSSTGVVVSHSELDVTSDAPELADFVFRDHLGEVVEMNAFDAAVTDPALEGESGDTEFYLGGELWAISFRPITNLVKAHSKSDATDATIDEELLFIVAFAEPLSDLVQAATDIDDELSSELTTATVIMVVVAAVTFAVLVVVLRYVLRRLGRPLRVMSDLLTALNEGRIRSSDMGEVPPSCLEVEKVLHTVDHLSTAVGFAHEQARHGDLDAAEATYVRALKLFTDLGHAKGISVCDNNLGNVYRMKHDYAKSESHYLNAVNAAESQLQAYRSEAGDAINPASVAALEVQLANRQCNIAMLFKATNRLQMALNLTGPALDVYEHSWNAPRFISAALSMIQLLVDQREASPPTDHPAIDAQIKAVVARVQACAQGYVAADSEATPVSVIQQLALVAVGRALAGMGDLAGGIDAYERSLLTGPLLDPGFEVHALRGCADLLQLLGERTGEAQCREQLSALTTVDRDVVLVLDTSGSMAGVRMRSSHTCLATLVANLIRIDRDRAAFLSFSTKSRVVLPLSSVDIHVRDALLRDISQSQASGLTALWDAMSMAEDSWKFDAMTKSAGSHKPRQRWIVLLSDGEDTSSAGTTFEMLLRKTAQADDDLNLLVIGIGIRDEYAVQLRQLCDATPRGNYFAVSGDTSQVESELQQAFGKIEETITAEGDHWETT